MKPCTKELKHLEKSWSIVQKANQPIVLFALMSSDLTYNQFHRSGNKVANAFIQLGMTKGDTVAVMLPNSPEFLAVWLGLTRIGVIEVPINTAFRGDLLTYILNKAECKAIVISSKWVERINQIESDLLHLQHVIVVEDGNIPSLIHMGWYSFEELISRASENDIDILIQPEDPSLILFTSGTTGPSKGVILTHSANFSVAKTACELMKYGPEDRLFTAFPLFHVNARYTTILVALLSIVMSSCTANSQLQNFGIFAGGNKSRHLISWVPF